MNQNRTYVIAEGGSCHDGEFYKAKQLLQAAVECRADAFKLQFWSDPDKLADRRHVPDYYREFYRRFAVPRSWLEPLAQTCHNFGIDFICTAFLPEDVEVVAPLVKHFKVASFEATSKDLLLAHAPFLKPGGDRWLIVSRGMGAPMVGTFLDDDAIRARLDLGRVRYLLCTSAYPAPPDQLNLRRLRNGHAYVAEGDTIDVFDGLSDHSDPSLTWTGALAVAGGAKIVEAHLKVAQTMETNPDSASSMVPNQFRDYVRHIRFAETALGDGVTRAQECEKPMMEYRAR